MAPNKPGPKRVRRFTLDHLLIGVLIFCAVVTALTVLSAGT